MNASQHTTADKPSSLRRWIKRIPFLLILVFVSFRYFQTRRFRAPKHVDFTALRLSRLDGSPIPDTALQGKGIVLNFWAPWCPPCRIETPWLQHQQTSHPNDLIVIGVVADSDKYVEAQSFMASRGVTYALARESQSVDDAFGSVEGLPTTYYIDPTGKVVHTAIGLTPEPLMSHYVKDILPR